MRGFGARGDGLGLSAIKHGVHSFGFGFGRQIKQPAHVLKIGMSRAAF